MNNSDEIISLYEKYGFELEDNQNPEKYLVFSHRKGYFQNAEILLIDLDFDFHNLEEGYKAAGFAVKINKYSNLDEIHSQLFSGFFLPCARRTVTVPRSPWCLPQADKHIPQHPFRTLP